jgi:tRNA 2-thiouridine synthesizing protein A
MQTNLDVKRLLCPMPVIRLGEMIEKIEIGDTIQIIATDPGNHPYLCKGLLK